MMVIPLQKLDFNILATHYYPLLLKKANAYLDNYASAEDAVQNTMLKAWSRLPKSQPMCFDRWIIQILYNTMRDAFRLGRRTRMFQILPDYDIPDRHITISNIDLIDEIDNLPIDYQDVCRLTMVDELEQKEIAEQLNIPIGTVQSRQYRSRKLLQKKFEELRNG